MNKINKITVRRYLLKILVSTLAVFITAHIISGVEISKFTTAILVAVILSILNTFVRPLLILLTIPLTLFSFGVFLLCINAFIILMASELIEDFKVAGFGTALIFSVILSVVTFILDSLNRPRIKIHIERDEN